MSSLRSGVVAAGAVLLMLATASSAQAITWAEQGDAGQDPSTTGAQAAQATQGVGELTSISGLIDGPATSPDAPTYGNEVDTYAIYLTAGTSFTADVTFTTNNNGDDTALYLFDSSGIGQVWNDNISNTPQNSLSAINNFSVKQSGTYYLAIEGVSSSGNFVPLDASGNPLFLSADPSTSGPVTGTSPAQTTNPFARWGVDPAFDFSGTGVPNPGTVVFNYTVTLQGAQAVPKPAVGGGLLAIGALGFLAARKGKAKVKQAG